MNEREVVERMERAASAVQFDTTRLVSDAVRRGRQRKARRAVGVVAVGVAAVAVAVPVTRAVLSADEVPAASIVALDPGQSPGSAEISLYVHDGRFGIRLGIHRSYNEDVELLPPSTTVGADEDTGEYFVLDGSDNDGKDLRHISLPAGTRVLYEATVIPDCENPQMSPDISFTLPGKTADGRRFTDHVQPSNPRDYATAMRLWCRMGISVQVGGGSFFDDGRAQWALRIVNGTDDRIQVTIPALTSGTATWTSASTSVGPHNDTTIEITGTGVACDTGQEVPWNPNRILIDGEPTSPPVLSNWCFSEY